MKKTHAQKLKEVADALKTGFWIGDGYDVKVYKEIQVPCTTGGECRFDYVTRVRPKLNRDDWSEYRGDLVLLHGFELKLSKANLKADAKFWKYPEHVHMSYFIVPSELVQFAIEKVKPYPNIGVADYSTRQVVKCATFTEPSPEKIRKLVLQMIF